MHKKIFRAPFIITLVIAAMISFSGCDIGGDIVVPSGATELSMNLKVNDATNTGSLIVTEAKALVTDLQYERERDGRDQLHHTGPYALNFFLNGSLKELMNGYVVRDIYTKVKFKLHKPGETETIPDAEFRDGTAESQRYSFIIKGTYNGTAFVYKSRQEMNIVVALNKSTNINLKTMNLTTVFNKNMWFKNGTAVLNPNDANNAALIDASILNSFIDAFQDNNKDGQPD